MTQHPQVRKTRERTEPSCDELHPRLISASYRTGCSKILYFMRWQTGNTCLCLFHYDANVNVQIRRTGGRRRAAAGCESVRPENETEPKTDGRTADWICPNSKIHPISPAVTLQTVQHCASGLRVKAVVVNYFQVKEPKTHKMDRGPHLVRFKVSLY